MGAPYSDLLYKCELAGVTLANTLGLAGVEAVTGQNSGNKESPLIVIAALNAIEEDPPLSGNFWVPVYAGYKYAAPIDADAINPQAAANQNVATLFDLFSRTDLPALLSAAISDFTVQAVLYEGPAEAEEGDEIINMLRMRWYACASALPA